MAQVFFDDFFEDKDLADRIESSLAKAREDKARLEIEVRSKDTGGRSSQDHSLTAEVTDPVPRIIAYIKSRCEASPGSTFEGELRLNFRQKGDPSNHYTSFTRQIRLSLAPKGPATTDDLSGVLMGALRQTTGALARSNEVNAQLVGEVSKQSAAMSSYLHAITPQPQAGTGILGQVAPLVANLIRAPQAAPAPQPAPAAPPPWTPEQLQAWQYYQQTGQWPAWVPYPAQPGAPSLPGMNQAPPPQLGAPVHAGAAPAYLPQEGGAGASPAGDLDPQQIKEWMKRNPQAGMKVALEAYNETPEHERPDLSALF